MSFNKLQAINAIDIALGGLGQNVNEIQALDDIATRLTGLNGIVQQGIYLPVASNLVNLISVTPRQCQFSRILKTVVVSGIIDIVPTAVIGLWSFNITPPIPTTPTLGEQAGGGFNMSVTNSTPLNITAGGGLGLKFAGNLNVSSGGENLSFVLQYLIVP